MTIKEVSKLLNISVRNLQYYDSIGLVSPKRTDTGLYGYRDYDISDIQRLKLIKIFKLLGLRLSDIKAYMASSNYDPSCILGEQLNLLYKKKQEIETLITFAEMAKVTGLELFIIPTDVPDFLNLSSSADVQRFLTTMFNSSEYKKIIEVYSSMNTEARMQADTELSNIFGQFKGFLDMEPDSPAVQTIVDEFFTYCSKYYSVSSPSILLGISMSLGGTGDYAKQTDLTYGEGAAAFISEAFLDRYCFLFGYELAPILASFKELYEYGFEDEKVKLASHMLISHMYKFLGTAFSDKETYFNSYTGFIESIPQDTLLEMLGGKETVDFALEALKYYLLQEER